MTKAEWMEVLGVFLVPIGLLTVIFLAYGLVLLLANWWDRWRERR